MNKDNVFCSSPFYMAPGDVLHILIVDETGVPIEIELSGDNDNYAPSAPTALDATSITVTGFTANWMFNENSTGYYLDVATDIGFTAMVAGYSNKDIGNDISDAVAGLANGTPYYYRVRAYNDYGISPNSNIITTTTVKVYGRLYNWYAATNAHGIAPTGYHLPTCSEMTTLRNTIDPVNNSITDNVAAKEMKITGDVYWPTPNNGTNSSGFSAKGEGFRDGANGLYDLSNLYTLYFNSKPSVTPSQCGCGFIEWDYDRFFTACNVETLKAHGASLRLIKDDSINTGSVTDIDGNVYNTVLIGTQVWMSESLKVEHYNDGTAIPQITNDALWVADVTGAMCWYNNTTP